MKQNKKCKRHVKYKRISFAPCNKSIIANTRVDVHRSKNAYHTVSFIYEVYGKNAYHRKFIQNLESVLKIFNEDAYLPLLKLSGHNGAKI